MTSKSLVWLASYPKSGNTWTRAFITNYVLNTDKPVPINEMRRFTFGDSMPNLYERVNKGPIKDLPDERILDIRTRMLMGIANNGADMNFMKTHNLNYKIHNRAMMPPQLTRMAIYIVRNPLGVVPSYARHFGMDHDRTIWTIAQSMNSSLTNEISVKEYMGTWSDHVESWTRTNAFPVHVMRYEDMKAEPHKVFAELLEKLGIPVEDERLDKAIRHSSFKELKRQEEAYGFVEQSKNNKSFFRSGKADSWKDELTTEQIARIRMDHGTVMQRFGYF